MGILSAIVSLASTVTVALVRRLRGASGHRLLRQMLAEQQQQRQALERIATALEVLVARDPELQLQAARAVAESSGIVGDIDSIHDKAAAYEAVADRLHALLGRDPSPEELFAEVERLEADAARLEDPVAFDVPRPDAPAVLTWTMPPSPALPTHDPLPVLPADPVEADAALGAPV